MILHFNHSMFSRGKIITRQLLTLAPLFVPLSNLSVSILFACVTLKSLYLDVHFSRPSSNRMISKDFWEMWALQCNEAYQFTVSSPKIELIYTMDGHILRNTFPHHHFIQIKHISSLLFTIRSTLPLYVQYIY